MTAKGAPHLGALLVAALAAAAAAAGPASAEAHRVQLQHTISAPGPLTAPLEEAQPAELSASEAQPAEPPAAEEPLEVPGAERRRARRSAAPPAPPAAPRKVEPSGLASWGENYFGQLGTFYRDNYELDPVGSEVPPLIEEVSASASFDLARLSNGTVVSWGGNGHGQLGDNRKKANWEGGAPYSVVQEEDPVTHEAAGDLHGVVQIAAAGEHALALMADGTVMAWGNNEYGQLGNGTQGFERTLNINERLPKVVPGLTGIAAIAAGGGSNFALTSDGRVLAWGMNTEGQLGLGTPGPDHCYTAVAHFPRFELCSESPRPVMWTNPAGGHQEQLRGVKALYGAAYSTYALLQDGRLLSWGGNHMGELGTAADTWRGSEYPPSEVLRADGRALRGVVEVATGGTTVLMRLASGEVLGWGSAAQGALAGAPLEDCRREVSRRAGRRPDPRPCVKEPRKIVALEQLHPEALSIGRNYGLALSEGKVFAWGSNDRGQLGIGKPPRGAVRAGGGREKERGYPVPTRVKGIGNVQAAVAAGTHSLAVLARGTPAPAPLIAAVPAPLEIHLSWLAGTSDGKEALAAERLQYRPSNRAGEPDPAEQGRLEDEEGPPVNLPEEPPGILFAGEPVEEETLTPGDQLVSQPGGWSGARPIVFTYQWQRCKPAGEPCTNITGATHAGYRVADVDTGTRVRVVVTATGQEAPAAVVPSAPTEVIEEEPEGRERATTSIRLAATPFRYSITETIEKRPPKKGENAPTEVSRPLEAIPYEVKFTASKKTRTFVVAPLPGR